MKNLLLFFCFLLILAGYSCKRNNDPNTKFEDSSKVTTLYWGDERIFCHDYWGMEASIMMFLPLMKIEKGEGAIPKGVLAERWEHSNGYKDWTIYLRKNIKWHDGVDVTAHDIKFTIDLRMSRIADRSLRPLSAKIIDDYSLMLSYKKPTDLISSYPTVYYPKHLLEGLDPEDLNNWKFWTEPIGNGPYQYVRHVPKTMIEVESNPNFFLGEPKIKHVVFKFAEDMSLIELISGNVDILPYAKREMLIKLDGDERFKSYYNIGDKWIKSIYWNHNNPLFENKKIRRALTMAINRRELIKVLNYPEELPIIDAIVTKSQLKKKSYPKPIPFDVENAIQILEEEGWVLNKGEDVRERNGNKFKFTILTQGGAPPQIPLYIQDQFRRIGVQMEIQTVDISVLRQRVFSGEFEAISYEAFVTPSKNWRWDHYKVYGSESLFGYDNPQMDSLLQIADTIIASEKLDSLYFQIGNIFNADIPMTFLFQSISSYIVRREIKGLKSPYMANPVYNMEYLWIDENN